MMDGPEPALDETRARAV